MCDCENVLRYYHTPKEADRFRQTVEVPDIAWDVRVGPEEARLVDEFRFAIDDLVNVLEQLAGRLLPVSREHFDGTCDPGLPPSSPARAQLYRIHTLTSDTRGIIDRLEV